MQTCAKKWQVVVDMEKPPVCGEWVAISGTCPGKEETVELLFTDWRRADGFTFAEAEPGQSDASGRSSTIPWLHFSDCMEIVGVERQDWRPPSWPHDKALWRLTVISLPSNAEFEKRLLDGHENRRGILSRFGLM